MGAVDFGCTATAERLKVVLPPTGAVVLNGDYDPAWADQAGGERKRQVLSRADIW